MADWYVWSGATGAGDGTDWANAYLKLETATVKPAGDIFYVAHDHYQTQAGGVLTMAFLGTVVLPNKIYCVDRNGSVPPTDADLRTTAIIETTGVSPITISGSIAEAYGLNIRVATGISSGSITMNGTASHTQRWVNCTFRCNGSNSSNRIMPGSTGASMTVWENCAIHFSAPAQFLLPSGRFFWRNSPNAFTSAVALSNMMSGQNASMSAIEGVDLTAFGTGYLVAASGTLQDVNFINCKLPPNYKMYNPGITGSGGPYVSIIRCSVGNTIVDERGNYMGAMYTDTTIFRTGGASDGTVQSSWRAVTNANTKWEIPFECIPITKWNETVGSPVTVTIEGIWAGAATPLNEDIWIDCEYRSVAGSPVVALASSNRKSLAAGVNLPAGSGSWSGSNTKFAMSATFTPQEKGVITIYVRVAKISSTFYIDPKPVLS